MAKWKGEFKVVTCVSVFSLNHQKLTILNETLEAITERMCQSCYTVCTFASCWHVGFWKWLIPFSPPHPTLAVMQDAACIRSTAISAFVTNWTNYLTSNIPFAWKFVSQDFYLVPWGGRLWQDGQSAGIPTGQITLSIPSFLVLRLQEGDGSGQYLDKCVFKVILTTCFLLNSLATQCFWMMLKPILVTVFCILSLETRK